VRTLKRATYVAHRECVLIFWLVSIASLGSGSFTFLGRPRRVRPAMPFDAVDTTRYSRAARPHLVEPLRFEEFFQECPLSVPDRQPILSLRGDRV
jgi:hypothetical protein